MTAITPRTAGACDTMRLRMKPPTRTCTALAVTAVESAGSAEGQQSAPLTFGTFDHTLRTDPVRPSGFMRQPRRRPVGGVARRALPLCLARGSVFRGVPVACPSAPSAWLRWWPADDLYFALWPRESKLSVCRRLPTICCCRRPAEAVLSLTPSLMSSCARISEQALVTWKAPRWDRGTPYEAAGHRRPHACG